MGADSRRAGSRPLVSVVIPHFHRQALLARALRSADAQRYDAVELIVVDDASPEDPTAFVAGLDLRRPARVLRLLRNAGPAAARNAGIEAAGGEYVALLDSDDEWLPEKLEVQVAAAEAVGGREDGFCISRTFIRRPGSEEVRRLWRPGRETLGEYFFLNRGIMQTSSFLVARPLALAVGFDPHLRQFEDILFVIRAAEQGARFAFQPERLSFWHRDDRDDQLSRAISLESGFRFLALAGARLSRRERLAFTTRFLGPVLARRRPVCFARQAVAALACGALTPRMLAGILRRSRRATAA